MTPYTRRAFVAATIAGGAVAPVALATRPFGGSGVPAERRLADELVRVFRNRDGAQAVGREYLRRAPEEADGAKLLSLIRTGCTEPPAPDAGLRALREWLRARRQQDFAAGRVVEVRGWLLSATEARLCALSALA